MGTCGGGQGGGVPLGGSRAAQLDEERGAVIATSPTLRQRELGTRLRQLRNGLGLTVEDVGEKLLCSATKISRIETGARRTSLRDVRDLCGIYGVSDSDTAELMDLARMAREPGWWSRYTDLNLDPYIGLEQDASSITCFSSYYVPALLQTEAYAHEIIRAIARQMDPEVHKQRVEARLRRQQRLEQDNRPRYRALLDEAVLRRRVGGPAVMADQLGKILKLEREGKATVQVIPFEVGAHAAQDGNFVFLEFQESPPVVFVELLSTNVYQERPSDLDRYREAVEYLRDEAMSPRDSIALIAEVQQDYANNK
jgi:transcriptional regulator with XRE-family HTH domain